MVRSYLYLSLLAVLLFGSYSTVDAQFFAAGQSPGSLRWSQIRTENFQVIFPREFEEQGRYIADVLEYAYLHVTSTLEHEPRRVSVIVHNHTVVSNGFVAWAPRRMELFTNPPADNEAHNWMEYLIVHELRHVIQVDKLNQGLTRLLGILFGEQATGAILGLFVPLWFLEGDAIVAETAFTHAGRGRIPSFEQSLRAQTLTYGIRSFDKAVFGSFKDYVPNQYELGYQLVAAGRLQQGSTVWAGVLDNVARQPWSPTPFSTGMKRNLGATTDQHYYNTFMFLDSVWTAQRYKHTYTQATVITRPGNVYTNFNQPHWVDDSTIIALRTGMEDIPRVVKIQLDGTETELFAPGRVFPFAFHFAGGKLVWNELRPDPRWAHRNWSEIMIWEYATGKQTRITSKGRYFAPALSPDATKIAAIRTTHLDRYYLVVLESKTGEEVFSHAYMDNDFIQTPAWHSNGRHIAVIATDERGKRIDMIDTRSGTIRNIMPPTYQLFSAPVFWGENLIFTGSWSGIDNIYKLDINSGKITKIISSEFGAVNAVVNPSGTHLLYSDYSARGYRLKVVCIGKLMDVPLKEVQDFSPGFHRTLRNQENTVISRPNIIRNQHEVERYRLLKNLFHLHSWAPLFVDAGNQSIAPGASLLFHNKLSNSFATLGYLWDENEQTGRFRLEYSFMGWYPVFSLIAESGYRRYFTPARLRRQNFTFRENHFGINVSLPLRFAHRQYHYTITPLIGFGINQARAGKETPDTLYFDLHGYSLFRPEELFRHDYQITASRRMARVKRDIFPRWGQIVTITYRHTPFSKIAVNDIFAVNGTGFFPGFFRHHGLRLSVSYQERGYDYSSNISRFYSFANLVSYPRGFEGQYHRTLKALTADYAFPLLYPDFSIRHLLYLMRISGHIFTDYAIATTFRNQFISSNIANQRMLSSGFGISGDLHLFRFRFPITLGLEVIFVNGHKHDTRLLFGTRFQ